MPDGYYIDGGLGAKGLSLCRYDAAAGKSFLLFTDSEYNYGSVQAANGSYVVYHAGRTDGEGQPAESHYRVYSLTEQKVILTLRAQMDGQAINPLFVHGGRIFCERQSDARDGHSIVAVDASTGLIVHEQPDILPSWIGSFYQRGAVAMIESGRKLYFADLAEGSDFSRIEVEQSIDGYELTSLQPGAISDSEMLFTAVYEEAGTGTCKSMLYRFHRTTHELTRAWETEGRLVKTLYAGGLCLSLIPGELICSLY